MKLTLIVLSLLLSSQAMATAQCGCAVKIKGKPFRGMEWKNEMCYELKCKPGKCTVVPEQSEAGGGVISAQDGILVKHARPNFTHDQCVQLTIDEAITR